jgi:hypothetical protein
MPRWIDPLLLQCIVSFFSLALAICMIIIVAGIQDQFLAIKYFIYGDGVYQSYPWRYSRTAGSRDAFKPLRAPNGTLLGYTARILTHRDPGEAQRCLADGYLMPFSAYQWDPSRSAGDLWPIVDRALAGGADFNWSFSHCLAWEYAGLCAAVVAANQDHDRAPEAARAGLRSWRPDACYLAAADGAAVTLDDWAGLSAPPGELRAAHAAGIAPRRVEGRLDLALWVMTVLVSFAKHPEDPPEADTFSPTLFSRLFYLYIVTVGDAYVVELVTVTTLFFYLYATSFLAEIVQLLHQIALACHLRCYEAAWLAARADPPAPAPPPPPGSTALALAEHCGRVAGDALCDLLLACRVLFVALMAMSSPMVFAMDHGVMPVLFSALGLAFLFDVDDALLRALDTADFRTSRLAADLLRPAIRAFRRRRTAPGAGPAGPADPRWASGGLLAAAEGGGGGGRPPAAARLALTPAPWGERVGVSAIALCVALLVYHGREAFHAVTDSEYAKTLSAAATVDDPRLLLVATAVALAGGAAAASRQGLAALPAAAQLACCVVWASTLARWGVSFVLCAWFMNTKLGEVAPLAGYFAAGFRGDAAFTLPALAAHAALLLLRPLPLLWARRSAARAAARRAAAEALARMHAAV